MKIAIQYRAAYRYDAAVGFSPHIMRLFPKTSHELGIVKLEFQTNRGADVQYRRDLFDNNIAACFYPEKARALEVEMEMLLEVQERNAFHFLLAPHAVDFPFTYEPEERRALAPYLDGAVKIDLPFWKLNPQPTVSALVALNSAISENLNYERRDEGAAFTPVETLTRGAGACRDFAVLLAETLRGLGVAARLASGYLMEFGAERKRAEGALHAWTEAYLPGAGWTGLDPTNGTFCNHNHLTAAVGLTPDDVAPISGNYYSGTRVPSQMESSLQMDLR